MNKSSLILFAALSTWICLYSKHTHLENYWELGVWGRLEEVTHARRWVQMEPRITCAVRTGSGRPKGSSVLEPSRQDSQAWSGRQDSDQKQGQESGVKHLKCCEARGRADQSRLLEGRTGVQGEVVIPAPPRKGLFCTWRLTHLLWHWRPSPQGGCLRIHH